MAAAGEPTEDLIELFREVTGLSRPEAVARLKANGNDTERATDEYFTDPDSTKYKYDESQFGLDRDGEGGNTSGISFNIQGPDQLPVGSYFDHGSAAPTRPPSRANNRSPNGAPSNLAQEDDDLQRALAESAAESGIAPQEAGIVDYTNNTTQFGPAKRPDYDVEQWAMVPTGASGPAIEPALPPSARKRQPNAPSFVRECTRIDCRLGAMLSIYHKIPLVRNILLSCGRQSPNYGHSSEWWKGRPILQPEALVKLQVGQQLSEDEARPAFHEEIHRLMAFLDSSDRAFARVDALFETPPYQSYTWHDMEERLLIALSNMAEDPENNPDLNMDPMMVRGRIIPVEPDDDDTDGSDPDDTIDFALLEIRIDQEQYSWVRTLYDALDQLMWTHALSPDHAFPDHSRMALLVKPSEVLTMRLMGTGLTAPIEIPEVFYADRYMESHQETALHLQKQIFEIKRNGLQKLTAWEAQRTRCQGEGGCRKYQWLESPHSIQDCHQKAIKHAQYLLDRLRKDVQWRHFQKQWSEGKEPYRIEDIKLAHTCTGPAEYTEEEEEKRIELETLIQTLQGRLDQLENDLKGCTEKREEYFRLLQVVSKRLTCEAKDADDAQFVFSSDPQAYNEVYWNPKQKYLLRGVALTPELSYVCVREPDDLIQVDDDASTGERDQWWKIHAPAQDHTPATVEKATIDEVLHAASTESRYPMLIYATEAAMQATPVPLSDALRRFVKLDNRSFQAELSREASEEQPPHPPPRPIVQGPTIGNLEQAGGYGLSKRKHTGSSSIATNGSTRDELDEVDLTFTDSNADGVELDTPPPGEALHVEYMRPSQFEDSYQTAGGYGEEVDWSKATAAHVEDDNSKTGPEGLGPEPSSNGPEMQERGSSGGLSFVMQHSGRSSRQGPPDLMDLEADPPYKGG
ncbi:uncharacterized protein B0I36DRAFT_105715 [Microdochium trichocladiopsis]|uniref:Ubiquitin interaction domain-containing protein n=1 Tax=Microdochium trichocladiopsis TaxID=1682393 RepID=A0A9P8Y9Q2_9PEZI|nr:uncharacterized protein B0I36DRAFT_105715 [Microdochium trichocladiopsis]KAH7033166.1 hypothetical protein B0I36DRAFT_105715 [Microdochium trichocladiopsis]